MLPILIIISVVLMLTLVGLVKLVHASEQDENEYEF
jgi:competence protein ComGC